MRTVAVIALLWSGYAVSFYGYCLLRGYDLSFWRAADPRMSALRDNASRPWPPPLITSPAVLYP